MDPNLVHVLNSGFQQKRKFVVTTSAENFGQTKDLLNFK